MKGSCILMINDSRKTHFIIVRLTVYEYNLLLTNMNKENKNISEYVRGILFKKINNKKIAN